jgi:hypothetical protein
MATKQLSKPKEIKRFNAILGKLGIKEDGKRALLAQYGVSSTLELTEIQLNDLCNKLEKNVNKETIELDNMRKRLIASIFAWRKAMGCATSMDEVKGIACKASGVEYFNTITKERLQSLYYAFNNKTKDLNNVAEMTQEQVDYLTTLN